MATSVRIGKRYAVVLPKKVRERLGLHEGDELLIEVSRRGILLIPRPKSYTAHLAGLHREVWKDVDVDDYLTEERKSWQR
ncbi:MAG TPA: AbrB/MazE/SpoVT family DNA-binding domain-containing protein [bacterium]|nr:AbrB/MazE/SpoVT family DNA-binding domain-containing protein [bacterium]